MVRNITLDFWGLILIILFITTHMQPLFGERDVMGWLISNGVAQITLPFFFIINGYYLFPRLLSKYRLKGYLLHLLTVYLVWTLIYLPFYIDEINLRNLFNIIISGYSHLWFLPALITGILIFLGIKKIVKNIKVILAVAIVIYIAGYTLISLEYDFIPVKNGLFIGFPFIAIGYYIRRYDIVNKVDNIPLIIILILSIITLLFESYTGYKFNLYRDMYLSLLFCCSILFILIMKNSLYQLNTKYWGELAAGVYLVHIFVIIEFIPTEDIYYIYKYPFVIAGSIILSMAVVFINKYVKIFL